MRARVLLLGEVQSVGRIGSHTTRTADFLSARWAMNRSTAEAPRRHIGQVGETKRTRRGKSACESNAALNSVKLTLESVVSGVCPGGAAEGPQRYTAASASKTPTITPIRSFFFISARSTDDLR